LKVLVNFFQPTQTPLKYYGYWGTKNSAALTLLMEGDGMCGGWADLLVKVLEAQGLADPGQAADGAAVKEVLSKYAKGNDFGSGECMLVKTWQFGKPNVEPIKDGGRPASDNRRFGYMNTMLLGNSPANHTLKWTPEGNAKMGTGPKANYVWVGKPAVTYMPSSTPGQSQVNPQGIFADHALVEIGKLYYDPSYGQVYKSKEDFQQRALSGFAAPDRQNERLLYMRPNRSDADLVWG
jgi:hypothetical protein